MENDFNDYLTKEHFLKAAPELNSSFEDGLMLQIEAHPKHAYKTNLNYSLLWLFFGILNVSMVLFVVFFQSISFATFFKTLTLLFHLPINQDWINFSYLPFLCLAGLYFFYFFDLFLNDYFAKNKRPLYSTK